MLRLKNKLWRVGIVNGGTGEIGGDRLLAVGFYRANWHESVLGMIFQVHRYGW